MNYNTPKQRHMLRQPIVLVLNKSWHAINDRNPVQAFRMVSKGVAVPLEILPDGSPVKRTWEEWQRLPVRDGDRFILSSRGPIRIPLVIVLGRYSVLPPAPKRVPYTVDAVWERDENTCQYCGHVVDRRAKQGNIDHVLPLSHKGPSTYENTVVSCVPCNSTKANRTPDQAGMRLRRQPVAPRRLSPAFLLRNRYKIPEWDVVAAIPH